MMKADRVRKIIAAVAVVAGAAWLAGVLPPLFRPLASGPREFYDWFFVCTTGPLMAIPGVGCICWGVRLFRRMDFAALKGIVGLVSVLGVIWISRYVPKGWAGSLPSSVKSSLGMLVGIAAAMLVYLVSVQRVLPLFGDEKRRLRDYLGRPVLQVLALLLWQLLSALSHEYVSAVLEPDLAWMLIASLGPILLAWGGYRMAVDKLLPVKAEGVDSIGRSAR